MAETTAIQARPAQTSQLWETFGNNFGVSAGQVQALLARTVISVGREDPPPTPEEVAACAIVCNIHNLNPFTKEIHAFRSKGKMLFAIGVDGWSKIAQRQPTMNGVEWEAHTDDKGVFYAMTCKIYRKDWALPVVVTEYLDECRRDKSEPWAKSPKRMMRNRSFSQAVRMAFAIGGLLDESEADQVTDGRYSGALIEPEASQESDTDRAIREFATKLNYNQARLSTLRKEYDGREEYLLSFLQTELAKISSRQPAIIPPAQRRAKQQAESQPERQEEFSSDTAEAPASEAMPFNYVQRDNDEAAPNLDSF